MMLQNKSKLDNFYKSLTINRLQLKLKIVYLESKYFLLANTRFSEEILTKEFYNDKTNAVALHVIFAQLGTHEMVKTIGVINVLPFT